MKPHKMDKKCANEKTWNIPVITAAWDSLMTFPTVINTTI